MAYNGYQAIPTSKRSDFIRLALILMYDRDEQTKRIRKTLSKNDQLPDIGIPDAPLEGTQDMSEAAKNIDVRPAAVSNYCRESHWFS